MVRRRKNERHYDKMKDETSSMYYGSNFSCNELMEKKNNKHTQQTYKQTKITTQNNILYI